MIRLETREDVAIITLDSAPVNALSLGVLERLDEVLREVEAGDARAVILTGNGKCFSAGLDLKQVRGMDRAQREQLVAVLNRSFARLYGLPLPVVAAVNGHAIAGGAVLTLAADQRLCVDAPIKLGLAEVRVGIPFPMGALAIVQNELTPAAFRMLALLGHNIDAAGALRAGVVDELVPAAALMQRAEEVARDLATLPRAAFGAIKRHARQAALQRIEAVERQGHDPVFDAWEATYPQ